MFDVTAGSPRPVTNSAGVAVPAQDVRRNQGESPVRSGRPSE